MVFDAAYQVACQFAVKEPHGQPHQLGEEIRDERHVDARTDVEQYTAPDHLNKCAAEYQHELCGQNELYKIQIPVPMPWSTMVCVRKGKTSCSKLPASRPMMSCIIAFL